MSTTPSSKARQTSPPYARFRLKVRLRMSSLDGASYQIVGDAHRFVPDVKLYINFLNELSVVPAPEAATQCDGDGHKAQKQSMRTYLSHHSITMHCLRLVRYEATNFPSRQHLRWTTALESSSIPSERELVRNPKAQKNLHETPNFAFQHGFVMRPATLRRLSSQVPILSLAAPYLPHL